MRIKSKVKKVVSAVLAAAMVICASGCSAPMAKQEQTSGTTAEASGSTEEEKDEKLKVAMLFPGPVNDASFNQSSYKGLTEAEKEYPVETAYSENVGAADMVSTMRSYCDTDYKLIILVGFDFADAMKEVAPNYPDVRFAIINGEGEGDNVSGYRFNTPETGFIAGAIAALLTRSNKVGYIAGQQFTHIEDAVNGFIAGAMYANPDIKEDDVMTSYLDSWTDTVKGKETALSYIEKGVDVICTNANAVGLGVIATCEENDVTALGYIADQHEVAPDTVPVSVIQDGGAVVKIIIGSQLDGTIQSGLNLLGAAQGVISYTQWYDSDKQEISQDVKDKMEEIYAKIQDGSLLKDGILPKSAFDAN